MIKHPRIIGAALLIILSAPLLGAAFQSSDSVHYTSEIIHPVEVEPIPENATRVCNDCERNDIQRAIDDADEGDTIVVEGGVWGHIHITTPVRLVGIDWPVIDVQSSGTAILIEANDVTVEGFDIRNTGRSFDKEDSGIYFEGQRNKILNNRLTEVHFGVNAALGHDSVIAGNYIEGKHGVSEGLRGDAIKVWYSHNIQIHNNHVTNSRDLLVWYSNFGHVYENLVTNSRYGFHFMNSDDGIANRNQVIDNSVGIYVMYGRRFTIENNLMQGSRGPSGHGLGLKEVDGVNVFENVIYDNRIGIYNDNSPYSMNVFGQFRGNLIAFNDSGLGILPSARANVYVNNSFVENLEQVTILGSGQLSEGNQWSQNRRGNFWSDYSGYDADGDGIGDVPFENRAKVEELRRTHPVLQLYRFSLAETAVNFASDAMPFIAGKPILIDKSPLVKAVMPENVPPLILESSTGKSIAVSGSLLATVGAMLWWGTIPGRRNTKTRVQA